MRSGAASLPAKRGKVGGLKDETKPVLGAEGGQRAGGRRAPTCRGCERRAELWGLLGAVFLIFSTVLHGKAGEKLYFLAAEVGAVI